VPTTGRATTSGQGLSPITLLPVSAIRLRQHGSGKQLVCARLNPAEAVVQLVDLGTCQNLEQIPVQLDNDGEQLLVNQMPGIGQRNVCLPAIARSGCSRDETFANQFRHRL
jgi:hypothetical protein